MVLVRIQSEDVFHKYSISQDKAADSSLFISGAFQILFITLSALLLRYRYQCLRTSLVEYKNFKKVVCR